MYFYFGLIKLRLWDPYFFMMTGFFFFQTLDLKSKNSMKNMRRTSQWCYTILVLRTMIHLVIFFRPCVLNRILTGNWNHHRITSAFHPEFCCLRKWIFVKIFRSSHPEVFLEKCILKICSKFTGEHPCRSAISIICDFHFWTVAFEKCIY